MTHGLTNVEALLCAAMATASLAAWVCVIGWGVRGLREWPGAQPRDD